MRRTAFHRSVIRSDARLDYPRVDRVFAGSERAEEPWAEPLAAARKVSAALQTAREARGAIAVESVEPEFAFNREGHVTSLDPSEQTESHRLIEHLMIAANEAVARLLDSRKLPALYRVHERPDPPRIERLVEQLDSLDVPTPALPRHMTPQQAGDVAAEISHLVDAEVRRRGHGRIGFTSLVLRSLKQAHYTPRNLGHYGLRSSHYCHFTSPIRRYPDLICHRSLLNAIGAGEATVRASDLEQAGEWCSLRERDAMQIERAADNVARAFLLEQRLFEHGWDAEFEGEVTGVIGAGAFIAFGGYEGLLPVRRLRGDWWELNEFETALVGRGVRSRAADRRSGDRAGGQGGCAARPNGSRSGRDPFVIDALIERELARFRAAHPRSAELHARARDSLFGGVPMPWMMLWAGGYPVAVAEATGSRVVDVDGHEYVDLCLGDTGAMAGHAPGARADGTPRTAPGSRRCSRPRTPPGWGRS